MNSRRDLIATLGVVALAGCTTQGESQPSNNETENPSQETEGSGGDTQQMILGRERHSNWVNGSDGGILDDARSSNMNFQDIYNSLENGDRLNAVADGLQTASRQLTEPDTYEQRHQRITAAVNEVLGQSDWDFTTTSFMNYTATAGQTIQYSEHWVPTEETNEYGDVIHDNINSALHPDYNHANHTPGEETNGEFYKGTMAGTRNSESDVILPPHDTEALENRGERTGDGESVLHSGAALMRYQLFEGGHETDNGFEYNPDQMLVPADKETHSQLNEVKYEQGVLSLHHALNSQYFSEGYDEIEGPVVVEDIERNEDAAMDADPTEKWNFELYEEPSWNWEQGYPAQTQ